MSRRYVSMTFDVEGINSAFHGSMEADAFISALNATMEKGREQGFSDFRVEISAYTHDDDTEISVGLSGSRPETREEQKKREAKEAQWEASRIKRTRRSQPKGSR
jgi:hypothetical protein